MPKHTHTQYSLFPILIKPETTSTNPSHDFRSYARCHSQHFFTHSTCVCVCVCLVRPSTPRLLTLWRNDVIPSVMVCSHTMTT